MSEYKLLDRSNMAPIDLALLLENIENPPPSTCTQVSHKIPVLETGIKRLLITGTLAGTLAISSLGNVLKDGNVKLKSPVFSEESLNNYNDTIEKPHDEYISALGKLISHKINMTRSGVVERVIAFKSLTQSWDGYGAIPLEVKSAANAVQFVYLLNDKIVEKLSDVYSTPNGTVSFVWENDDGEGLTLELGNNTLSYYVKYNSQKPKFYDNIEINTKEVARISEFVKTI